MLFTSTNKGYGAPSTYPENTGKSTTASLNTMRFRSKDITPPGTRFTLTYDGIAYNDKLLPFALVQHRTDPERTM